MDAFSSSPACSRGSAPGRPRPWNALPAPGASPRGPTSS